MFVLGAAVHLVTAEDIESFAVHDEDTGRAVGSVFATTAERWTGESQELDQDAADAVNRVFLLYSKAFELHDRASRLIDGAAIVEADKQLWRDTLTAGQGNLRFVGAA